MNLQEIRAELCVKAIEFEQAIAAGLPHRELIKIYKEVKELQYRLIMAAVLEKPSDADLIIE
jgi:hypothetical protein